jgi:hypothetical protein
VTSGETQNSRADSSSRLSKELGRDVEAPPSASNFAAEIAGRSDALGEVLRLLRKRLTTAVRRSMTSTGTKRS